jgi:hypothetical protein
MNFARATTEHPVLVREPSSFVSEARRMFSADRKRREYRETDEDEFHYESPAWAAERVRQFATIKDLLTADTPGTS